MFFITQEKKGISAMELRRLLGISYSAAPIGVMRFHRGWQVDKSPLANLM